MSASGADARVEDASERNRPAVCPRAAAALAALRRDGPFDAVVCDSVLNSVDSLQAESDVLDCLIALCRPGGSIFLSGRRMERTEALLNHRLTRSPDKRYVEFLDDDGFSAIYRRGVWTFQKFHTFQQAKALAAERLGPIETAAHSSTSWQIVCRAERRIDAAAAEAALRREFDLPWPDGDRLSLANAAVAAWRIAPKN